MHTAANHEENESTMNAAGQRHLQTFQVSFITLANE
jgi:hypothetical protein